MYNNLIYRIPFSILMGGNKIMLGVCVAFCLFLVGCLNGVDFEDVIYGMEPVQEFMAEHPDARLSFVHWDVSMVEANTEYIEYVCGSGLPLNEYWLVTVEEGSASIVLFVDVYNEMIKCFQLTGVPIEEGEVDVPEEVVEEPEEEPRRVRGRTLGNEYADVHIIHYCDFQDPFCKRFYDNAFPYIKQDFVFTDRVFFEFRDYPLEAIHLEAFSAAEASRCAEEQGYFWQMVDTLYNRQDSFTRLGSYDWAEELGLDRDKYAYCMNRDLYQNEVRNDAIQAEEDGVNGVPAFFINGEKLMGAQPYRRFKEAIEEALDEVEEPVEVIIEEPGENVTEEPEEMPDTWEDGQKIKVRLDDSDRILGNSNAQVKMVEYGDWHCEDCADFAEDMLPLLKEQYINTGLVSFEFKDYPMFGEGTYAEHDLAMSAALAARCAQAEGKFWEMHDIMHEDYDNMEEFYQEDYQGFPVQGELTEFFGEYAEDIGLHEFNFTRCLEYEFYDPEVFEDREEGKALGVSRTPTFFINDKKIIGAPFYELFDAAIRDELGLEVEVPEEVEFDGYAFSDYNDWDVFRPDGKEFFFPNLDDDVISGIGSGYSESLEPGSFIFNEVDIDAEDGFELTIEARSGSSWPNAAAVYLYSGQDTYLFRLYGESSNYNMDWYIQRGDGSEDHYRLYVGPGLLDEWHEYRLVRDWRGNYKLFIDDEHFEEFNPPQEKELTHFDTVGISLSRQDSQLRSIEIEELDGPDIYSDDFSTLVGWSSNGYGRDYRFPTLENGVIRGQGSGYSDALEPWPTMFQDVDIDSKNGFEMELRARSGSSWPNAAYVNLYNTEDTYYRFRLYGESSNYNIDLDTFIDGEVVPYRYHIGSGVLSSWHDYKLVRDDDEFSLFIDGELLEGFNPPDDDEIEDIRRIAVIVAREDSEMDSFQLIGS